MISDRRVKIVATIGPATESPENLKKAIEAGVNVARLNFSHGDHPTHLKVLNTIREHSKSLQAPVAILQDLQGPKIRVGKLPEGAIEIVKDDDIKLSYGFKSGNNSPGNIEIPVDFSGLAGCCEPGTKILFDDGLLEVVVTEVEGEVVTSKVIEGGLLKDRKGVNIPGANLSIECMTEKDLKDLAFGLEHKVDYVALSFVRKGDDIRQLRELINKKHPDAKIIAKIEMLEAIDNLEEIIDLSDGVMVARGDLAVEVGHTLLPGYQKKIIDMCNKAGCPVITATQMLDSMVVNSRPTRAEITDVANAVIDGSDALMLSAESASGKNPFKCISTMSDIIREVEKGGMNYYSMRMEQGFFNTAESIAASACLTAFKLKAEVIVCLTTSGKTATMISSYRPKARIIAVTDKTSTLDRLQLVWGIHTLKVPSYKNSEEALQVVEEILLQYGLVQSGERIIVTLGLPVFKQAKTNSLRVYNISDRDISPMKEEDLPLRLR